MKTIWKPLLLTFVLLALAMGVALAATVTCHSNRWAEFCDLTHSHGDVEDHTHKTYKYTSGRTYVRWMDNGQDAAKHYHHSGSATGLTHAEIDDLYDESAEACYHNHSHPHRHHWGHCAHDNQ